MTSNQGKRLSTSSAASQLIGVVESINKNASDYRDSDSDNDLPIKSMAVDSGRNSDGGTDDDNSYINNPLFAVPSSAPRTLRGGRKNGGTSTTISYPARPLPAERPRTPLQKTPSVMSFGRDPRTAPPRSVLLTRRDLQLRYLVLAIGCLLYAGSFYSYDIPSALHEQLRERMTASNNFETYFNLLYTVYSVPNVLLPLLGGYFVDRVGPVYCIYMFSLLLLVGQSTFSLGTYLRSWAFMICGRTIYGLGAESLAVGISSLVATWFDKPELAMAFAMTLSVGHVASILVDVLSPRVASAQGTVWAVVVGMVPNLMNVILSLVLFYVEEAGERKCRGNEESLRDLTTSLMSDVGGDSNGVTFNFPTDDDDDDSDVLDDEQDAEDDNYSKRSWVSDMRTFGPVLWLICIQGFLLYGIAFPFNNIASGLLLERNYLRDPDPGCTLRYPDQCTSGTEVSDSSPNPSVDASGALCPPSFAESGIAPVLPSSLNFTYTSEDWLFPSYVYDDLKRSDVDCDDPFFSEACAKDFCDAQAAATKKTGRIMSIPYLISVVLMPIFGIAIDRIGCRGLLFLASSLLFICVHLTLAYPDMDPEAHVTPPTIPLIGQGIAYAMVASVLWASIPLSVGPKQTGTAYGIAVSFMNTALAIVPLIVAKIYNANDEQYLPAVEGLFVSLAFLGIISALALNVADHYNGGKLNALQDLQTFWRNRRPSEEYYIDEPPPSLYPTETI